MCIFAYRLVLLHWVEICGFQSQKDRRKRKHIKFSMGSTTQKYSLKWNDFTVNVASTFRDLHSRHDFVDVTLACADGSTLEAHKVILSSVSSYFRDILKVSQFFLTWISCKDPRKVSSEKNIRSNLIVLIFLECKMKHLKPNFIYLVPGVFEIRYTLFM